jgi:SAM-dependent methyltransferase
MPTDQIKQEVGRFYDQVGWQQESTGFYQNAQYEDLRAVSADYIAKVHARVGEHLTPSGQYLLDAGSGPVQYEAYLAYSAGYQHRMCMDLSHVALIEARKRLGDHGLYVVGDIAHLPFNCEVFDGIVALHTIHHLPVAEKPACYQGLYDCLKPGRSMVTVDGWQGHGLGWLWALMIRVADRLKRGKTKLAPATQSIASSANSTKTDGPAGTFVIKNNARWFKQALEGKLPFKIYPWRSVSVHWLRSVISDNAKGKRWLDRLYRLETRFPRFFGENGQYPLIVFNKPGRVESGTTKE